MHGTALDQYRTHVFQQSSNCVMHHCARVHHGWGGGDCRGGAVKGPPLERWHPQQTLVIYVRFNWHYSFLYLFKRIKLGCLRLRSGSEANCSPTIS